MLFIKALLTLGLQWKVRNGQNVYIWNDHMITSMNGNLLQMRDPNCQLSLVCELIDTQNHRWNIDMLKIIGGILTF